MTANSLVMTMPPITTPVPGFVPPAIAETLILADPGFVHLIISFPLYILGAALMPSFSMSLADIWISV